MSAASHNGKLSKLVFTAEYCTVLHFKVFKVAPFLFGDLNKLICALIQDVNSENTMYVVQLFVCADTSLSLCQSVRTVKEQ